MELFGAIANGALNMTEKNRKLTNSTKDNI